MAAPISDHDLIRTTIAQCAIALDTNTFSDFRKCFTEDCVVDYVGSFGKLQGIDATAERLERAISHLQTHHALTTQAIYLKGEKRATAVTYCAVKSWLDDKTLFAEGRYDDVLVKVDVGGTETWLIKERTTTNIGVPRGDFSIMG
ncbi:hypothetical protein FDECE_14188 [Fusarium decemcellulare]|nr:hypothetical protein FDECE_14188 [Fusarium decemcellulare]